jgi:hypothetical protein
MHGFEDRPPGNLTMNTYPVSGGPPIDMPTETGPSDSATSPLFLPRTSSSTMLSTKTTSAKVSGCTPMTTTSGTFWIASPRTKCACSGTSTPTV